jgi:hypothetical protein
MSLFLEWRAARGRSAIRQTRSRNAGRTLLVLAVLLPLATLTSWLVLRQARPALSKGLPSAHLAQSRPAAAAPTPAHAVPVVTNYLHLSSQTLVHYGSNDEEVGMVLGAGRPPVGPEAFALGNDGNVLVADVVNHRVTVYGSDGTLLRSIKLPGVALGDVMSDREGRIYVYDQVRRALLQFTAEGAPCSTLDLEAKDIDTRGYFHVVGGEIYFADGAAHDVLVATLQDGLLKTPDASAERTADGIHGESGRIYSTSLQRGQALQVQVTDPTGAAKPQAVQVPFPGIVSARYLGEDQAGRFYVQAERLQETGVVLEVVAFGPKGEPLATTCIPENDYAVWTTKLLDVRPDGTLVQFIPQQDQAKLNLFANKPTTGTSEN